MRLICYKATSDLLSSDLNCYLYLNKRNKPRLHKTVASKSSVRVSAGIGTKHFQRAYAHPSHVFKHTQARLGDNSPKGKEREVVGCVYVCMNIM